MANINRGDVLCIPDPNSDEYPADRLDVIALESGPNPQVLAPDRSSHGLTKSDLARGETFQLSDDLFEVHQRTESRMAEQLDALFQSQSGVDMGSLGRDVIKEIAEQLTDATIDKLVSTTSDLNSAAQEAVKEFLQNNPELVEKLAHPDAPELAEIVVQSFLPV